MGTGGSHYTTPPEEGTPTITLVNTVIKRIRDDHTKTIEMNPPTRRGYKRPRGPRKREEVKEVKDKEGSVRKSRSRSKRGLYDLSQANDWVWFVSGTLDPGKVDRYDFEEAQKKASNQLHKVRRKYPGLKWLFVPEQHKDGAWHFHGLLGGPPCDLLRMIHSGKRDNKGRAIYNWQDWTIGFTTATRVGDREKAAAYIMKYVTKDGRGVPEHKRRYWASRTLDRPTEEAYYLTEEEQVALDDNLRCKAKATRARVAFIDRGEFVPAMVITYRDYRGI